MHDSLCSLDTAVARYEKMISRLPEDGDRRALSLSDVDLTQVLLTIHGPCKEFALIHSDGSYHDIRQRALEHEHRHRIWTDPSGNPKRQASAFQGNPGGGGPGKGKGRDKSTERKCYLCGKPGHMARDCRQKDKIAQSEGVICHACGQKGHFASSCPNKPSVPQAKGQSKAQPQGGKGKGKNKGKGKGKKGKGKQSEFTQSDDPDHQPDVEDVSEPAPEESAMSLMTLCHLPDCTQELHQNVLESAEQWMLLACD